MKSVKSVQSVCPCKSGNPYEACCKVYHDGLPAPTAAALMRSRYSAYVLGLEDCLLATWHPDTRPQTLDLANEPPIQWLGLDIKRAETEKNSAIVEFVARYKVGGKAERLHEISRFALIDGCWFYLTGDFVTD